MFRAIRPLLAWSSVEIRRVKLNGCSYTNGAEMGKMMVAEGIGLTVLPDYSVHGDPLERAGLIVTRPLTDDTTVVTMAALHRRQPRVSPTVRDMLDRLRHQARRPPAGRAV